MSQTETFAASGMPPETAARLWPAASVRAYLLTVIVLATVPLMALMGWMIVRESRASHQQFELGLQRSAASFALTVQRELTSTVDALTILSYSPTVRDDDVAGFFQTLVELPRRRPSWSAAFLIDPDGRVLFSTARAQDDGAASGPARSRGKGRTTQAASPAPAPAQALVADAADEATFRQVKETLRPAVSNLILTPDGMAAVGVQVPVVVDGRLRYVLGATVDASSWSQLLSSASLPPDSRLLLVDGMGRVLASTANASVAVGDVLATSSPASGPRIERASVGPAEPSYTAWQPVDGTSWLVGMDVPAAPLDDAASHAIRTALGAGLLSLIAGLCLALLLARHLTRPLRQLAMGGPDAVEEPVRVREIVLLRGALRRADAQRRVAQARIASDMAEREALAEREQAARQEAETANRIKDEFMAMLSHELRNPLGAISSATELLNRMDLKEPRALHAVTVIGRQTRHLARLMEDLLDVARVITGKIMLSKTPLDLATVTRRLVGTLDLAGVTRDHRVNITTMEAPISADLTRIEQVIGNLVTNALKYTPGGGLISIDVRPEGDSAVLEVRDNGVGIAPALLPKLFDLFVQGDRALDRRQGGLGVGLTLVKRLVELHGGTVEAESPGVGSVFRVSLPLVPGEPLDPSGPSSPAGFAQSPRSLQVVLVEDNEDALEVMRALLELSGHVVRSAMDGAAGLQLLIEGECDVAFVDIGLPGLNGLEVCQRARAAGVRARLVALTGYGQAKDVEGSKAAGFDLHLVKPIDPAALRKVLDET